MTPPVKYTTITQLPIRARIALFLLYLTSIITLVIAGWIAADRNFGDGVVLCTIVETSICLHLIRRT